MNDNDYMEMALSLAEKGRGFTSPNPMVGAVVVKDGKVIGKGWHEAVGKAHAEVNAIDDAGKDAEGGTIYVTLEPCNHTGRTPPCTEKILSAGIKRVVVAMEDPNLDVTGGGIAYLKAQGLDITSGILEDKAIRMNEIFVKFSRTRRPFVILKCASTLDGQLATRTGDSKWVTGPDSRAYVHEIRQMVDGILVGMNTVLLDNPSLTTRLNGVAGRDPSRIILDTRLSIPEDAKVLQPGSESDIILFSGISLNASRRSSFPNISFVRLLDLTLAGTGMSNISRHEPSRSTRFTGSSTTRCGTPSTRMIRGTRICSSYRVVPWYCPPWSPNSSP